MFNYVCRRALRAKKDSGLAKPMTSLTQMIMIKLETYDKESDRLMRVVTEGQWEQSRVIVTRYYQHWY